MYPVAKQTENNKLTNLTININSHLSRKHVKFSFMSNFIHQRVIERKKTSKKQYAINTKIQSICKITKQSPSRVIYRFKVTKYTVNNAEG